MSTDPFQQFIVEFVRKKLACRAVGEYRLAIYPTDETIKVGTKRICRVKVDIQRYGETVPFDDGIQRIWAEYDGAKVHVDIATVRFLEHQYLNEGTFES